MTPTPAKPGGNAARFDAIFRDEIDFVLRSLLRFGVGARDADDVAQEVFVTIARKLDEIDPSRPVRPYLWGVCRRMARDYRELAVHRGTLTEAFDHDASSDRGPSETLEGREAKDIVHTALMLLPQERREAFILYELEGMTLQEIAEMENTSINTIASRVRKARIEFADAVQSRKRGSESADDVALDAEES